MSSHEESALFRFLNTRGAELAGCSSDRALVRGYPIVATLEILISVPLLAAGLFGPDLLAGLAGSMFFLTGGLLLWMTAQLKHRLAVGGRGGVRLSREAAELLRVLLTRLDTWPLSPRRQCRDVLAPEAYSLLSEASLQYNRIQGTLAVASCAPALALHAGAIRAASDDAMAEILHLAALVNRFPESATAHRSRFAARAAELGELAEQVEDIQAEGSERVEPHSGIRSVLEQLRQEQQAREELRIPPQAPQQEERRVL